MEKLAIIVTDLGYGDAGKGKITDSLVRQHNAGLVIRYTGGAQAAHRVVAPDGREHVFSQFGSGTFVPGVRTYLSQRMVLHPLAMASEAAHLSALGINDALERTLVDAEALVITPYHMAANRLREMARGGARHGSCGMGVGETVMDSLTESLRGLRARDLKDQATLVAKLRAIGEAKRAELAMLIARFKDDPAARREMQVFGNPDLPLVCARKLAEIAGRMHIVEREAAYAAINSEKRIVLEGSQGALLDEWYGFFPYVTRATTTSANARSLLESAGFAGAIKTMGVIRAYSTRHGPGPFVTEDALLSAALTDPCNTDGRWQGGFRVGWLDLVATRYAMDMVGGVDELAVTNLDRLAGLKRWKAADAYLPAQDATRHFRLDPDGSASSIIFDPSHDLVRMEELTRDMLVASPKYSQMALTGLPEIDAPAIIARIEASLGRPVTLSSFGPSHQDTCNLALSLAA